jgi:serine/threonine protein kinase
MATELRIVQELPAREATPFAGKRQFGRYQLLYRFASGGMAQLYLARLTGAEGFTKLVALKVIHQHLTEEPEFVNMFIDEARLASRIAHPNVVHIIELGRVGDVHFIAMEYVEGESLGALLRKTLPPRRVGARIIADAAAGLHAAHELRDGQGELLNVVHRDVSPQNILISYDGAVKVVDFGVARARGSLHTTRGQIKGKLSYMAPEQLSERRQVDRRTDVFALGIVLFETTTRRRLFKAESEELQIAKVLQGEIIRPSRVIPDYPPELEQIVMRALDRDQTRRFQSAQEMQRALERFIIGEGEPVLQSQVGELMRETFTERIGEKKELLEEADAAAEDDSSLPDVELVSNASIVLGSMGSLVQSRRRVALMTVVGGAVMAAIAVVVTLLLLRQPEPAPASAAVPRDAAPSRSAAPQRPSHDAGPGVPATITIGVRATPRRAKIVLDGKEVANPLELTQPARPGKAKLVVTARGYAPQRFEVPLDRGGAWVVALQRRGRPGRPRHATKTGSTKKPTKKGTLGDDDVVVNPYE